MCRDSPSLLEGKSYRDRDLSLEPGLGVCFHIGWPCLALASPSCLLHRQGTPPRLWSWAGLTAGDQREAWHGLVSGLEVSSCREGRQTEGGSSQMLGGMTQTRCWVLKRKVRLLVVTWRDSWEEALRASLRRRGVRWARKGQPGAAASFRAEDSRNTRLCLLSYPLARRY